MHRQSALGNRDGIQRLDPRYELGGEGWAGDTQSFSPRTDTRYDPKIMLGLENKKGFQVLAWEYTVDFR